MAQQPYPDENTWWRDPFDREVAARYAQVGRIYPDPNDPTALRWASRTAYDIAAGMTKEASLSKHLKELEDALGLTPEPGPTPPHPGPLVGRLRYQMGTSGLWQDDTGPVLPMFCHYMSAFSDYIHKGLSVVDRQLGAIAAAGYHGVRVLDVLGYWDASDQCAPAGWFGRAVTPYAMDSRGSERCGFPSVSATPDYYGQKRRFLDLVWSHGLRIMDDRGDLNSWSHSQKLEHMGRNGELYAAMGDTGKQLLVGLWACNESWQNGVPDHVEAAQMLDAFANGARWLPDSRGLSWGAENNDFTSDPTGEMPDSMKWWSIDPATCITMHGSRTATGEHLTAHYLGYGFYDGDLRSYGKRSWNTEPIGGGDGITVGRVDDPERLVGIATEAILSGQAWTFMSGAGVWSARPIEGEPAFQATVNLLKWLPKDLHTFGTIGHASRPEAILRDDKPAQHHTRADYAIHADGRFVMNCYSDGNPHYAMPFARACSECQVIDVVHDRIDADGPRHVGDRFTDPFTWSRLVVGRLA